MDGSKEWSNKKGLAKGTREEVKSLNHYLEEVKAKLMNCYQEMQIHKQLITAAAIKNKFLGADEKDHTRCKVVTYHNTR